MDSSCIHCNEPFMKTKKGFQRRSLDVPLSNKGFRSSCSLSTGNAIKRLLPTCNYANEAFLCEKCYSLCGKAYDKSREAWKKQEEYVALEKEFLKRMCQENSQDTNAERMAKITKVEGSTAMVDLGDDLILPSLEISDYMDDIVVLFKSAKSAILGYSLQSVLESIQQDRKLDELKSAANVVCSKKRKGDQDIQNECYSTDAPAKKKPLMIPSSQSNFGRKTRSRSGVLRNKSALQLLGLGLKEVGRQGSDDDDDDDLDENYRDMSGDIKDSDQKKNYTEDETDKESMALNEKTEDQNGGVNKEDKEGTEEVTAALPLHVENVQNNSENIASEDSNQSLTVKEEEKSTESTTLKVANVDENTAGKGKSKLRKIRGRPQKSVYRVKDAKLKCKYCPKRYPTNEKDLEFHMKCHMRNEDGTVAESFKCPYCAKVVPRWHEFINHMVTHEQAKIDLKDYDFIKVVLGNFQCQDCGKQFDLKANLLGHRTRIHNKETDKQCEICGEQLGGRDYKTIKRHFDKCRNVVHQCELCDYKTTVKMDFNNHMRSHQGAFACATCDLKFASSVRLWQHKKSVHEGVKFNQKIACSFCGLEYAGKVSLLQHVTRCHKGDAANKLQCELCNNYTTHLQKDLERHIQRVHDKKIKCEKCPFQTNSQNAYKLHTTYHDPSRVHPCEQPTCWYRAATKFELGNHMRKVHAPGNKICPICHKSFHKRTELLRHVVLHSGVKAYGCDECGERFQCHSTYYRHRRKTGHDSNKRGTSSMPQVVLMDSLPLEGQQGLEATPKKYAGQVPRYYKSDPVATDTVGKLVKLLARPEDNMFEGNLSKFVKVVNASKEEDTDRDDSVEVTDVNELDDAENQMYYIKAEGPEDRQYVINLLQGGELLAVDDAESLEALASISNLEVEQVLTKEEEENQESLQEVSIQEVSELEGVEFTHKEEANEVESQIVQYQVPVNKDGTIMIETDQGPAEVPRSLGEAFTLATGGSTENMSEFSIVTSTATGEEKIILVMAPEGSEPEAALSMLKLQSST